MQMLEQHVCVGLATQSPCLVHLVVFPVRVFFPDDFQLAELLGLSSRECLAHFDFDVVRLVRLLLLLVVILRRPGTLLLPELLRELLVDDSVERRGPTATACTCVPCDESIQIGLRTRLILL